MKKTLTSIILCIALTAVMAGCGSHTHEAADWKADMQKHWQVCEDCGEEFNEAEHNMDEFGYCEECRHTVTDCGDGNYEILAYDEQGTIKSSIYCDAEGNVLEEIVYENEYFDDGNPKHTEEYHDGVLVSEETYEHCENQEVAEVYMKEQISYNEDGSKSVTLKKEDSYMLSYTQYDADGNVITADVYEYTYDDAGNLTKQVCLTDGEVSMEAYFALDEDGNSYTTKETYYDTNGDVISEYVYE